MYAKKAQDIMNIIQENFGEILSINQDDILPLSRSVKQFQPVMKFTVQVGAFGNQNNALRMERLLCERHFADVRIQTKRVGSGVLYLVWVGNFNTFQEAHAYGEVMMRRLKIDYNVVKITE